MNSFNAALDRNKKGAGKGYVLQGLAYSYAMSVYRIIVILGKFGQYEFQARKKHVTYRQNLNEKMTCFRITPWVISY